VNASQSSEKLREYLLGGLAEREREAVEQRCFTDDEFFLEMEAAEHDLIDHYVRGLLAAGDRTRFETSFLASPGLARRVEMARYLIGYIDQKRPPVKVASWWQTIARLLSGPVLKPVLTAAACLVIVAGAIVYFQERETPVREQARVQVPRTQPNVLPPAPQQRSSPERRSTGIPAFLLTPGLSRSGSGMPIVRLGDAERVRLQLLLESVEYARYHASIETPEGRSVFKRSGLTAGSVQGAQAVILTVLASSLAPGDYIVRLSGADPGGSSEPVSEYAFRATRN
jgi:hypothetical protein